MRILTLKQEAEITSKYETHSSTELADTYGCTATNIRRIWRVNGLKGKSSRSYYADFSYFDNIDTEDKSYFLGFIAADGCIAEGYENQQKRLQIALHSRDADVLEKFKKCIKSNQNILSAKNSQVRLSVSSDKLCNALSKFNIVPRKTSVYKPVMLEYSLMPHFVRGYFDGNGTIHCESKTRPNVPSSYATGITCNIHTAQFFKEYLESVGVSVQQIKKDNDSPIAYDVRIYNIADMYRFLSLMYENATIYLDKKYEMYLLYKQIYENKYKKELDLKCY